MVIDDRILRLAAQGGWIGVDLDGTLFEWHEWKGWNVFGAPIAPMVARVRAWRDADVPVRIVTARVGLPVYDGKVASVSYYKRHECRVTQTMFSDRMMVSAIQEHCLAHGLPDLPVQCYKDVNMIELWDDRAVQVVANTGQTLADAHAAELSALRGKQFSTQEWPHEGS